LHEIGHSGRDKLLLLIRGGLKRGEETHDFVQIRAQLRIGRHADRPTAPETIARTHDCRSQQVASVLSLRPVLLKGEVEFQDQRPQRLRFRVLGDEGPVGRPYEQAEHQSQQQAGKADNRAEDYPRPDDILDWQQPLEEEPEQSADESQQRHDQGPGQGIHASPPAAKTKIPSPRSNALNLPTAIRVADRPAIILNTVTEMINQPSAA